MPLLCLIFVNDIVSDIGSNIRLFADDTSMYLVVENPTLQLLSRAILIRSQVGPINDMSTLTPPNINVFFYHATLA